MKRIAIIFGGAGYIGRNMLSVFLKENKFEKYIVCDIQLLQGFEMGQNVHFIQCDVRESIEIEIGECDPSNSWIFNFAAVHREPGHAYNEYFDTNIPGALHVTDFARQKRIKNILFTSSIAPYGKSLEKRTEESPIYPETAYGISKALAEKIHESWQIENDQRRLIIVRPSVIFGPKDPGNVYRMIKSLKKGTFILPNGGNVIKAYGYIFGLIDSFMFVMDKEDRHIVYNYAENPLVPLKEMTLIVKEELGFKKPTLNLSVKLLSAMAWVLWNSGRIVGKSLDIHPVRVRKAGFPTNIEPRYLIDNGFNFKYNFGEALNDWISKSPEDF